MVLRHATARPKRAMQTPRGRGILLRLLAIAVGILLICTDASHLSAGPPFRTGKLLLLCRLSLDVGATGQKEVTQDGCV
ncbi:MAG TPA: hypothetical protein VMT71_04440 [Syntrophorhabdales bacterium]|nr:hypothetical protein [Syntrophorhabdales bacterium]